VALDSENGAHAATVRVCAAPLNAIKFSKDGEILAAAASNGIVYLYKVRSEILTNCKLLTNRTLKSFAIL